MIIKNRSLEEARAEIKDLELDFETCMVCDVDLEDEERQEGICRSCEEDRRIWEDRR